MRRSAEQGSGQVNHSQALEGAHRHGNETAAPVTVVTDADYRCIWRPCEALEIDEDGSPSG